MYTIKERKDGKWELKKKSSSKAYRVFDSEIEAIRFCESKNLEYENNSKSAVNMTVKSVKKHGFLKTFIILLVVAILGFGGYVLYSYFASPKTSSPIPSVIEGADFSIHFLELGNEYTGDATYIKAGENDILIDAGSRKDSSKAIKKYIDQYVTDGKLEYVIATHAHQDHIAGFIGSNDSDNKDGILYEYKIGTIIDFSKTGSNSGIYRSYLEAREFAIKNGAKHFTAAECFEEKNGASKNYDLGGNMSFDIIYNKYYFEVAEDENDYSVCTMFNYNDHHFFLTGDLEHEGEMSIASYYDGSTKEKTLPKVDVFKAGHHGSESSSNHELLSIIEPKICAVCCCAGSVEYTARNAGTFPTQKFIDRISKYTDKVYVTSYYDEKDLTFKSLNGNIKIECNGTEIGVNCSNNNTILKDSEWFNQKIFTKGGYVSSGKGKTDFYSKATAGAVETIRRVWPK